MATGITNDASEIARAFKAAFLEADNLRQLKATVAWANMEILEVKAPMDVTSYKGETYQYPKDWSPLFWKWVQVSTKAGVVPEWAKKIVHCLVEGDTAKDRSMRGRQNIAVAFCNAVEDQLDLLKSYIPRGTEISAAYNTADQTTLGNLPAGAKLKPAEFAHLVRDPSARRPIAGDFVIPCGPYELQKRENKQIQWEVEQTCNSMSQYASAWWEATVGNANTSKFLHGVLKKLNDPKLANRERTAEMSKFQGLMADQVAWMNEIASTLSKFNTLARHAVDTGLKLHVIPTEEPITLRSNFFDAMGEDEPVRPCMEQPSAHLTSQPPVTGESGALKSVTSGTTNVGITGIADNPLEGAAATNVVGAVPTAGMATAPTTMLLAGGVGPELMAQTGYGESVATLIGKKVFKRIIPVNTGITQGTIIFKKNVDPWDPELLNTATYEWAKMHQRFYGRMRMHIQFVTASTVIGAVKFYYVPKLLEDVTLKQETLDNMGTYVELSLASAGEAVLEMNPTIGAYAVTGIMRDKGPWGVIVGITSTDIANAYSNSTSVQIKLSFSLAENSVYDIPAFLTDPATGNDYTLDLGYSDTDKLVVDGNCYAAYDAPTSEWTGGYGYKVSGGPKSLGGYIMFANEANTKTCYICAGYRPLYINGGRDGGFDQDYTWGFSDYSKWTALGEYTRNKASGYYNGYEAMKLDYDDPKEVITWSLATATQTLVGNVGFAKVASGTTLSGLLSAAVEHAKIDFRDTIAERVVVFRHHDKKAMVTPNGVTAAWTRLVAMTGANGGIALTTQNYNAESNQIGFGSSINYSDAVATTGYTARGQLPAGYYRLTISDKHSYIPSVAATCNGATVPCTYSEYADMHVTMGYTQHGTSVVTELRTKSGVLVGEVVRNQYGMFCYMKETTRKYSAMIENLSQLVQNHRTIDVEWPQLKEFNKDHLGSRQLTSFDAAVALNGNEIEEKNASIRQRLLLEDVSIALSNCSVMSSPFSEDVTPCIAPAVALAGAMAGQAAANSATSLLNSFLAAPNIKRVEARGAAEVKRVEAQGAANVERVKGEQNRLALKTKAQADLMVMHAMQNTNLAKANGGVWTNDPVHGLSLS